MTAAQAKRLELDGLPRAQRESQMKTFLAAQAGVAEADVSPDGSVWARFTDGRYFVMNNTMFPEKGKAAAVRSALVPGFRPAGLSTRAAAASDSARKTARSRTAGTVETPKTARAYLLTGILDRISGITFPLESPPNPDLKPMLEDRGYTVIQHDADVDFLRTVGDAAVLHLSTHGGIAGSAQQGQRFYSVYTSTEVTPENDVKYADDLNKGRLVYFSAPIGYTGNLVMKQETHYAITEKFVRDYAWSFTPNSFAFVNCCWSEQGGFNAVLRSLPKPCAVTAGWSNAANPQKAWDAARFFFDRMLGANAISPKEPTNQRPFDIAAVYADADKRGITDASTTDYGPTRLLVTDQASTPGGVSLTGGYILAPSIATMDVHERSLEVPTLGESRLTLHGMFGSEQGAVTVDGTPVVSIVSWAWDEIVCKIADKPGPGFAGNVQVVARNGAKSNLIPLTAWQGKFTYSNNPLGAAGNIQSRIDYNVVFRADLHDYRTEPGGALKKQGPKEFRAAAGSTAHWEMFNGPLPGYVWVKKSEDLPYGLHGSAFPQYGKYGTGYVLEGTLDRSAGVVNIAVNYLSGVGTMRSTIPNVPDQDIATLSDPQIIAMPIGSSPNGEAVYQPKVAGTINDLFVIGAGSATGLTTQTHNTRFTWSALSPTHAPDKSLGEDQK